MWARCKKQSGINSLAVRQDKKEEDIVLITGNALNIRANDQTPVCVFFLIIKSPPTI